LNRWREAHANFVGASRASRSSRAI